ncbi:hypothetical protein E4U43_004683 [Claviceps pusilla]|uniref:Uncharacterized protein n=1 Tax=Claviceps pusilla TaxID=123648 RepID=A0A9P7NGW9_9HYPO|nr:hypothetical protein E4U43_004683 [Claviceps pusilla]
MHFSTSTTIATIAFLAGQTLAACGPGLLDRSGATRTKSAGLCNGQAAKTWMCGNQGTSVKFVGGTFTLSAPEVDSVIGITCFSNRKFYVYHCEAGGSQRFNAPCWDNLSVESVVQVSN